MNTIIHINAILFTPYNPFIYFWFVKQFQNCCHIGKGWLNLNMHVVSMPICITGLQQWNFELNKIGKNRITELNSVLYPLSGVFFPSHSYILLFMCSALFYLLKLPTEVFVDDHSPLISWMNICLASPD